MLILLIVLCFTILLILHMAQKTKQTTDLKVIYKKLLKNNPRTIAWTFGWIEKRNSYKNVYVNNDKNVENYYAFDVKYENHPIAFDGKPLLIDNTHGVVTSHSSGFSISGVNSDMPFNCPSGYSGPECQQSSLCDAKEAGTYKLLSRDQFKTLNLYNYTGSSLYVHEDEYPYHQRLRVKCLNETGKFDIEACADNKLVDRDTVQCKIYDLCNDRLDGHKHNYPIAENESPLNVKQYYVCETNKSVLRECTHDTVFSNVNMGCIAQNKCYGLGEKRLVLDDESYLQCSGDIGQIKRCKYGVGLHYETPYCMVPKCIPRTYSYDDGLLRFITGMVWCDENDNAHQELCDERANKKEYRYTWGTQPDVVVRIPNWPHSVFDETRRICVEPTMDGIMVPNAYIKVQWTNNMKKSHDFDVRTKRFVCQPKDNLLQLDYVKHRLIPDIDVTGKFVDYSVPCQTVNSPVPFFDNIAFSPFKELLSDDASLIRVYRPDNGRQFPLIYAIPIDNSVNTTDVDAIIFPNLETTSPSSSFNRIKKQNTVDDNNEEENNNDDDNNKARIESKDTTTPTTDDKNDREPPPNKTKKSVMAFWPQYHDGYYYTFDYDSKQNRIVYFKSTETVLGFRQYSKNKPKEWDSVPECLQFESFLDSVPMVDRKLLYLFMIDGTVGVPKNRIPAKLINKHR